MSLDAMQRMHPKAVKLSMITSLLFHAVVFVIVLVLLAVAQFKDWPVWPFAVAEAVIVISGFIFTGIIPRLQFIRFAYFTDQEEIRICKGLWWISDIIIPMVKVQHVELESGPLMRRSELAHVTVVTAATRHRIYGLERADAEAVQRRIAEWARVREDDV